MENTVMIPDAQEGAIPEDLLAVMREDITEHVRYYSKRSCTDMLELGKWLTKAKEIVPHGEWETYVKEKTGMKKRTAQNFMQAYQKYGTKNDRISNLSIGQVIALLPATQEEEDMLAEKDLSEMSTREIRDAIRKAREEERAKAREGMEIMAADKIRELAKQKDAIAKKMQIRMDELLAEKDAEKEAAIEQARAESEEKLKSALEGEEKRAEEQKRLYEDRLRALNDQMRETLAATDELKKQLSAAEEAAKDATQAAIDGTKSLRQQNAEAETQARKLRRELEEKDDIIRELQEQYDQINREYLNAQSAIAKGDAERSSADILSAAAVSAAARDFIGQVGRVPFMHGAFATMSEAERDGYRQSILMILDWAKKSLNTLETVDGNGGIIE